jgi:hypothetical protein
MRRKRSSKNPRKVITDCGLAWKKGEGRPIDVPMLWKANYYIFNPFLNISIEQLSYLS